MLIKDIRLKDYNIIGNLGVAVSGGSDSMALLHYLYNASKDMGFSITVINVEHGIRGKESIQDSEFVKAYCKANNIPYICSQVDAPSYSAKHGFTLEQGARELRYSIFDKLIEEKVVTGIALAHHLDDQCETILMRIFRGTGINGLRGIAGIRGGYIRPFINISKEEINNYITKNNIKYRDDSTNSCTDYTRNFIRLEVLAKVKKLYPSYTLAFERLKRLASEQIDLLDELCPRPIIDNTTAKLDIKTMTTTHNALIKRSLYHCMRHFLAEVNFEEVNFEDVLSLIGKENGSRIYLANQVIAYKEYDYITFAKQKEVQPIDLPFAVKDYSVQGRKIIVRPYIVGDKLRFDLDKIPSNARIRKRKEGDIFKKFGGGTKSLGDYLTDKKIPKRVRDNLLLIAADNNVLAIVGIEISDMIAVEDTTEKTYTIMEESCANI